MVKKNEKKKKQKENQKRRIRKIKIVSLRRRRRRVTRSSKQKQQPCHNALKLDIMSSSGEGSRHNRHVLCLEGLQLLVRLDEQLPVDAANVRQGYGSSVKMRIVVSCLPSRSASDSLKRIDWHACSMTQQQQQEQRQRQQQQTNHHVKDKNIIGSSTAKQHRKLSLQ